MGRSTIVVIWLALALLALRPVDFVESASRRLFEPARLLSEITAPLARAARVRASADEEQRRRARVRALLLAEQEHARPDDPALLAGRGLVHAQVIERSEEKADVVVLRFPPQASIEKGMPVVCGECYVGTVAEVGRAPREGETRSALALGPGEARVELLTSERSRVGARGAGIELVVGGLVRAERGSAQRRLLAVRALEHDPAGPGEVRVHEREAAGAGWAALAEGYRLGSLVALAGGPRAGFALEPALDYRGGFSQVFVLCPPERAPAGALLAQDPFDPGSWRRARVALDGTPSFWRETRRLCAGSRAGLRAGAAVAAGTEFVGRLARVDLWAGDVECLGDPGFRLLLLAEVEGQAAPVHLGRATTLGCDASRTHVYLGWEASAELERALGAGTARRAELYTGSGERGVPPGLHLGHALLDARRGARVLVLERELDGSFGSELDVWTGTRAEEDEP